VKQIKDNVTIPVILFPGNYMQVEPSADALLFLSLISGRNPELLIGQHVIAAPILKNTKLEIIPTGYILINSGPITSVAYISNTTPIPDDKYSLAACTAMAGEMLGLQSIYLDAGSGAEKEIGVRMIASVRKSVSVPLIVGGGINTSQKALNALEAGADMIVIGNALEKNPNLLSEISDKVYEWNQSIEQENRKGIRQRYHDPMPFSFIQSKELFCGGVILSNEGKLLSDLCDASDAQMLYPKLLPATGQTC
jgi:putative glycerol-1-phosphate prenyltransferase